MCNQSECSKNEDVAEFSALFRKYGFQDHSERLDHHFFMTTLQKRINENRCSGVEEYLELLQNNPPEVKQFSDNLNIGFSEFFRNPLTFSVLENIILPGLIKRLTVTGRRELRIWSVACAAGHEVYSLSVLLNELQNSVARKFSYRIFASDINQISVKQAVNGVFPVSSLGKVTLKRFETWFDKSGDTAIVKPTLRNNIVFLTFDLFDENVCYPPESIFGDFDLVMCANILYYYNREAQKQIFRKLEKSLAHGGYIMTSEAERRILRNDHYKEAVPHSAIFRKEKKLHASI